MYTAIYTTFSSNKEAKAIIKVLLESRLAACANTSPIESTYMWEGKITKSKEIACLIKTQKNNFIKIKRAIENMHSYEAPCIISLNIAKGNKKYLDWIKEVTV